MSDDTNERVAEALRQVELPDGPADYWSSSLDLALRDCVPWLKARGYGIVIDLDHGDEVQLYGQESEHPIRTWPITNPPSIARAICEAVVCEAEGGGAH